MRYRLLTFSVILFFAVSCKKDGTVKGKVTDFCSGIPSAGKEVLLYYGDRRSSLKTDLSDKMNIASDGTYSFTFGSRYGYWIVCGNFQSDYLEKGETNEINIKYPEYTPNSYLDLLIKNTSPFDNNDSIYIDYIETNSFNPMHNKIKFKGISVDTTQDITVDGCQPRVVNLNWAVTKNHITTTFSNQVTCNNSTTTQYQINY